MEWLTVKIGAQMFDFLHAAGLALVVAAATGASVELRDEGLAYSIESPNPPRSIGLDQLIMQLLELPSRDELCNTEPKGGPVPLSVRNLDGLLASQFTTPGARIVSIQDLRRKATLNPSVAGNALVKVERLRARLLKGANRFAAGINGSVEDLLRDYDACAPVVPRLVPRGDGDICVPMTIEPAFGYSTRRMVSDGLVTNKTSVAIEGARYASLLAFVGAARFLRAQRLGGNLVNFYVPVAEALTIDADFSLPVLSGVDRSATQALALCWLKYWQDHEATGCWLGLCYQVMQTQGVQQSISMSRGCLSYDWLTTLESRIGSTLIDYWVRLLSNPVDRIPIEIDNLMIALLHRDMFAWIAHLRDFALFRHCELGNRGYAYRVSEIRELTSMMTSHSSLLSIVLERENGTVRIGRALRLLGRQNRAVLRDLQDELDSVTDRDEMLHWVGRAAQACALALAKSRFIVVPNDDDFLLLMKDVEQFGVRSIAEILFVLSELWYSPGSSNESEESALEPSSAPVEEEK